MVGRVWCGGIGSAIVAQKTRGFGAVVSLLVLAAVWPSAATAAECTNTWTGPAEGTWTTAGNWSAGHVPTETEVACVGLGKTVKVTSGTNKVGVVQGEGSLAISGATLELKNSSEASSIKTLTMELSSVLTGPGSINISGNLAWAKESTMSGSGSTVILPGATGSTTMAVNIGIGTLKQRRLVNEGTFTMTSGRLSLTEGGELLNAGTFKANSESETAIKKGTGSAKIVNAGTFKKTSGAGTTEVEVSFENKGIVSAEKGKLKFTSGGSAGSSTEWAAFEGAELWFAKGTYMLTGGTLSGPATISGASTTVSAEGVGASSASVELKEEATLSVPGGSTTLGSLTMTAFNGKVTGAGTLKISSALSWKNESMMTGSGSTVILPGATATATLALKIGIATLKQRHLVNEGTFTFSSGRIAASEGAVIENTGTFNANSESTIPFEASKTGAPSIINTGSFQRTSGSGSTEVGIAFENKGTVNAQSGTLEFTGGGSSTSAATWKSQEGAKVKFAKGSFALEKSSLSGAIAISGSATTVTAESVSGKGAQMEPVSSGTLSIASGSPSTIDTLTMGTNGVLNGAGTINIENTLNWTHEGTMTGVGATVVSSGASGTASPGTTASLKQREFVNKGTFVLESGRITASEGAVLENTGTFTVNSETSGAITVGSGGAAFFNSGTFRKAAGAGVTEVQAPVENKGTISAQKGTLAFSGGGSAGTSTTWGASEGAEVRLAKGLFAFTGGSLSGSISISGKSTSVIAEGINGTAAKVELKEEATFTIPSGSVTLSALTMNAYHGKVAGAGTLRISGNLAWAHESEMTGSGSTVILPGATATMTMLLNIGIATLEERKLVNEGTFTMSSGRIAESKGAILENTGTFLANSESLQAIEAGSGKSLLVNTGTIKKTSGSGTTEIGPDFENLGMLKQETGKLLINHPVSAGSKRHLEHQSHCADPVECASGNFSETQADFAIGGRGVGLLLTRTYSAQAAIVAAAPGAFGFGWTNAFSDRLVSEEGGKTITLVQSDGGAVQFTESGKGSFAAPSWSQDTLSGSSETGYLLILPDQIEYGFSGAGMLESVTDRNGNKTTLSYDKSGKLEAIADPAGRKITLTYNGEGLVESAKDPMGHVIKYAYEGKDLKSVTLPGEEAPRWQFKYDASHRMTTMTDGRGGKATNEYDGSNRVISQTDPAGRTIAFEYGPFHTKVTNKATGSVTDEWFTSNNQPFSITRGYGTADATTETFSYSTAGQLTGVTDGNGHTTSYDYDAKGNRFSERDPLGNEREWAFNETHDVVSETTPGGETTTIARDGNGNVEGISRPGPEETTQTTTFEYDEHGQLESITDPLERTWTYGYDSYGNRTSEADPLGNTQTLGYDNDSRLTSTVTPRGNAEGAKASEYTTAIERDPLGRPLKATDPLGGSVEYAYDPNGNLEAKTDANGHTTSYTYSADNERIEVEKPNGAVLKTKYDGAGTITGQTDANEHTTAYVRNALGEPIEVVDPLGRKTTEEFDAAGNLKAMIDPAERKTSYAYDKANRLIGIGYSDGTTPNAEFEYDPDGNVIKMVDGTGESTFGYDQLGRLREAEDGHGSVVGYGYNLGEELTGILYPNGKAIARTFDKAGRLEAVTDWLEGTTTFSYDADSNLEAIAFPVASGNADEYAYDQADRMSGAKFTSGPETLASLSYLRDKFGQVEEEVRSGLPGSAAVVYGYDESERLVEAGAASFEYDQADSLTKAPGTTNTYDAASQLEAGTGIAYSYDKFGERTKATPEAGPATDYGYDQAGNLISVERPEEGEVPTIEEAFAYDATSLLASKTTGLTTHYFTWDNSGSLPFVLNDGENSYIYGPNGLPIEQVDAEEVPSYLHHDQLGSTRLLTDASGEASAGFSYTPYGELEGVTGTAATPLGFAGQYTDAESGLQYLRARFYDSATAQFLTKDPLAELTRSPYEYARNNPLTYFDPTGRACVESFGTIGRYPNILDCLGQGAEEVLESPATGPVAGVICALTPGCGAVEAIAAGLFLTTVSNILHANNDSCFDFVSNQLVGMLVLLVGGAPGGLLDMVPGSIGGLSPLGRRVLEIANDAPGLFLEFVHALQGQ